MVFQLTQKLVFPDPHYGEPDGLLAVGGDLSVDRLLLAYSNGIFPWYAFREKQIQWWCPLKRFVIFPNEIHISHSMRTFMNKEQYQFETPHLKSMGGRYIDYEEYMRYVQEPLESL